MGADEQVPAGWEGMGAEAREEWLLEALERNPLPVEALVAVVRGELRDKTGERAAAWAELVRDALGQAREREGMTRLLECLLENPPRWLTPAWAGAGLDGAFRNRSEKELVVAAGFGGKRPLEECVRRLRLLLTLAPGTLCHDKTWGAGTVSRVDAFYGKVVIDFPGKPAHPMTFAYAADSLELLAEDHLLARLHHDKEAGRRLAAEDPAELVRVALRSFGPQPVNALRERLETLVLGAEGWKAFWDAARRGLKDDPLVEIPARRSEPVRLLSRAKAFDADWVVGLQRERDPARILEMVLERESAGAALDAAETGVVVGRLAFAAEGAELSDVVLTARLCLAADRLAPGTPGSEVVRRIRARMLEGALFRTVAEGLPARDLAPFLAWLEGGDAAAYRAMVAAEWPACSVRLLDQLVPRLPAEEAAAVLAQEARTQPPNPRWVAWACRHEGEALVRDTLPAEERLTAAVDVLEQDLSAEDLRAQNLLRTLFGQAGWLEGQVENLSVIAREALLRRIMRAGGWDVTERRSVMARLVKRYPDLEAVTRAAGKKAQAEETAVRLTSWRSYRERQGQLKRLIEVDIPQNSQEIGVARSYGDLRENFEYQAAKDRQRILMQRQAELERDLREVKGTDFAQPAGDAAGPGCCVWVRGADGQERRFCVLGEWDRDDALGILPSGSAVAQALTGRRAGETVALPAVNGTGEVTVLRVGALEADVRAWLDSKSS
jgi:transcription elongation GreA/GreB family factor